MAFFAPVHSTRSNILDTLMSWWTKSWSLKKYRQNGTTVSSKLIAPPTERYVTGALKAETAVHGGCERTGQIGEPIGRKSTSTECMLAWSLGRGAEGIIPVDDPYVPCTARL